MGSIDVEHITRHTSNDCLKPTSITSIKWIPSFIPDSSSYFLPILFFYHFIDFWLCKIVRVWSYPKKKKTHMIMSQRNVSTDANIYENTSFSRSPLLWWSVVSLDEECLVASRLVLSCRALPCPALSLPRLREYNWFTCVSCLRWLLTN